MKQLCMLISLLIWSFHVSAIDTIYVPSKISEVTVFFSGAQVHRSAEIQLKPGIQMLAFDQLTFSALEESFTLNVDKDCDVHSFHFTPESEHRLLEIKKEHQKQLDSLEVEIKLLNNLYTSYSNEFSIMRNNQDFGRIEDLDLNTIKNTSKYLNTRTVDIFNKQIEIKEQTEFIQKQIKETNRLYSAKSAKLKSTNGVFYVLAQISTPNSFHFSFSYLTPNAEWIPSYDFRVENVISPLNIVYQANVIQSTSEDWKNVQLTLSTGTPNASSTVPSLKNWYFEKGDPNQPKPTERANNGGIIGLVMDESKYFALPGCRVIVKDNYGRKVAETTTSHNGLFSISPLASGNYSVILQYLGYEDKRYNAYVRANQPTNLSMDLKPDLKDLIEVQENNLIKKEYISNMPARSATSIAKLAGGVYSKDDGSAELSIRGSRADANYYYIDGIKVRGASSLPQSSIEQVSVITGGLPAMYGDLDNLSGVSAGPVLHSNYSRPKIINSNLIDQKVKTNLGQSEFKIAELQTILSNGKSSSIEVQTISLNTEYTYTSVPKYTSKVYLEAELTDWFELSLLPGSVNIFYQGTYTGNTYINPYELTDTLNISLGVDNSILVKRETNAAKTTRSINNKNIKEVVSYSIEVFNNKEIPIKLKVKDQVPTTQLKSVDIIYEPSLNASWDKQTGFIEWIQEIEPNSSMIIPFEYEAKYPTGYAY